jgi:hypothetical protein
VPGLHTMGGGQTIGHSDIAQEQVSSTVQVQPGAHGGKHVPAPAPPMPPAEVETDTVVAAPLPPAP